jgi:3-oxoacyl-[acyl-carrier protein] reductase
MELDGKVAVITGSGRGIGEAAARKLAAAGARVVVSDIDGDVAEAVAQGIGGAAHIGDLTAPGACDQLIATAIDAFGQLDIVVNNAGVVQDAPLHKITDEQMQQMLDIHTIVPMRVLRAAAPHLRNAAKADLAAGRERFRKVVNVVAFGLIETRMTADLPDEARAALARHIPLGRGATPDEAAGGIYYLCSPGSDYVHGQVLAVSGGLAVGMAN